MTDGVAAFSFFTGRSVFQQSSPWPFFSWRALPSSSQESRSAALGQIADLANSRAAHPIMLPVGHFRRKIVLLSPPYQDFATAPL
jgi:hypothetical protein